MATLRTNNLTQVVTQTLYEQGFGLSGTTIIEKTAELEITGESTTYRDLTTIVVLNYNEPATALASDNASDFDDPENYVFDELALVGDNDELLTHLIFHPIQKSLNRKLEIRYTLRITAGS